MTFSSAAFLFLDRDGMRPVSLGSMQAMRHMGLTLLTDAPPQDLAEEQRQVALFTWLHTQPLPEVMEALWLGTWRAVQVAPQVPDLLLAGFRADRDRLLREIVEAAVSERKRPQSRTEEVPSWVVPPRVYDFRLLVLMRHTHQPREQLEWHWPVVDALRMYHAARWSEGVWTARPGEAVAEADFEGFGLDAVTARRKLP